MAPGAGNYDFPVDTGNSNSTYGVIFHRIAPDSDVLDIGCASGNLALALESQQGCRVLGVELDPDAAAAAREKGIEVVCADITSRPLEELVGGRRFDAVVMADILEHLVEPERLLAQVARMLRDGGCALASFPNVSHVDIQLMLAQDEWRYVPAGLLDRTHLRYYTVQSFAEMAYQVGFDLAGHWRVVLPVLGTEVLDQGRLLLLDAERVEAVRRANEANENATVYQHVVELVPDRSRERSTGALTPAVAPKQQTRRVPRLDVVVVTDGERPQLLVEALYSCAAVADTEVRAVVVARCNQAERGEALIGLLRRYEGLLLTSLAFVDGGTGAALNCGLSLLDGDYAAFIRDADVLYPTFGQRLVAPLDLDSALSVAIGRSQVMRGEVVDSGFTAQSKGPELGGPLDRMRLWSEDYLPLNACAIRTSDLRDLGTRFSEQQGVSEDWAFLCELAALGRFQYVPELVAETHIALAVAGRESVPTALAAARTRAAILAGLAGRPVRMSGGELAELADRVALATSPSELADLREELTRTQLLVSRLLQSRSWRVTRPLRNLLRSDLPD